jgi:hypothetical protein
MNASFEKYLSKRHNGTDRLFVHPKDSFVESESAWCRKESIGANAMAGFMKNLSRIAELSTEYTQVLRLPPPLKLVAMI